MSFHRSKVLRVAFVASGTAALLGAAVLTAPVAHADSNNNTSRKLQDAVTAAGIMTHLQALQDIADANGGTRVSGSPGYDQSVDYVQSVLVDAGYQVTRQAFEFQTFVSLSPSVLQQITPGPTTNLPNAVMSYSGSGDVTASATVPGGVIGDPALAVHLGCEAVNFSPANAGTIVIMQRGLCPFATKATNAYNAGAVGVVIYNNVAGALNGTLGNTFTLDIGATGITQALGESLVAQIPGLTLRLKTDTLRGFATTYNLLAESRYGDPDNVVMAGAHLDSVNAGEGINDNGSGSAALLEIAVQMEKVHPTNKVRFAWWGAEESNLVGSTYYIANLPAAERQKIALYLNFDMVGSPNYVRFVYDGDNSAFPVGPGAAAGPPGSGAIEALFHAHFAGKGLASAETAFSGRSDYGPFIAAGVDIPSGGLFTGAEGIKTAAEAAIYGGTAGVPYDPCYHQECDDINNPSQQALEEMSDAMAHAVITYAFDTRTVNGEGKGHPVGPPGQSGSGNGTGSGPSTGHVHDEPDEM
jgi:Zn-dependent M28 family amino/carboxypeptidase